MPSTGGGSATGANGVFLPPGQDAAAATLGQLEQPLANLSMNAGAGTPAGQAYPSAMALVENYLSGSQVGGPLTTMNYTTDQALNAAQTGAQYGINTLFPQDTSGSQALAGAASGGLPYAGQTLQNAFDPAYSSLIAQLQGNPYQAQAQAGAQQGATLGGIGATRDLQLGDSASSGIPGVMGMAGQLSGAVPQLLSAGFDPQAALFNRGQSQLLDQSNAVNAMSGLAGTPYGASTTANALGNFDINWQNQQLAREAQGAGAAGNAATTAGGLYGQGANLATQAGGLYGQAPALAAGSAALPSNTFTSNIGQILQGLQSRNTAGVQGAASYGSLLGGANQGLQGAGTLGQSGVTGLGQNASMPYNTGANIASNALAGLNQQTQLGNNQFALPNQTIGNLMQYMGLGQNASQLAGNLQNQNFNQLAQGIGGGLSGVNTLFGGNGLLSGGGGLLGGGAGAAGGIADFGGGGAALGVPDVLGGAAAGGGSDILGALAPAALSA